ncbi:MAG: 16S rRNA (cytidine(1402)-2'-O)-methyltransferase [Bifidobacteriaceae bacterium]|jgi:16S rRNA (cytidine1402-2'-O)-methyltransferase|nr:16S rRNA (cytidine(1402)-2'-O)-methyltransferase [Bifidobacteriaceae bacterium]
MVLVRSGVVLAATPLGDPDDASFHLRQLLAEAPVIAAEDTRRLRDLVRRLGIKPTGRVVSFYDANEVGSIPDLLRAAGDGVVVVVSDAGTPLISDPGFPLVRAAIEVGIRVTCAPGPSAVIAALAVSGLPVQRFAFDGFVPRTAGPRGAWLESLRDDRRTVVAFDSPRRLATTLDDAAARLGPDRPACVARELTKPHEEILRGDLGWLASLAGERDWLGEVVLLIGPGSPTEVKTSAEADAVTRVLVLTLNGERLREAVDLVAGANGLSRRALYQAVLDAKSSAQSGPGAA